LCRILETSAAARDTVGGGCVGVVKTRDQDRQKRGTNWTWTGQGTLRVDGGGSVPGAGFQEWLGTSQSPGGFWRSTTCAIKGSQPTTPRRATPTSRSRSSPRRTASLLPSERLLASGAIPRAHHASPPRAWRRARPSHTHFTPNDQYPPSQSPRDPPQRLPSPAAGHSHAVPSAASQQPLYTQSLPQLASVPDASR
jgi:hypothetical protein